MHVEVISSTQPSTVMYNNCASLVSIFSTSSLQINSQQHTYIQETKVLIVTQQSIIHCTWWHIKISSEQVLYLGYQLIDNYDYNNYNYNVCCWNQLDVFSLNNIIKFICNIANNALLLTP